MKSVDSFVFFDTEEFHLGALSIALARGDMTPFLESTPIYSMTHIFILKIHNF